MPNDILNLLQEYDGLASAVANANHAFYQQRLGQWFSFIDETPNFARVVSTLESLNDFEGWYRDLEARQKNHGMGGALLNFPRDRNADLGMQITLFRRMADGKIQAAIFAHTFISPHEKSISANLRDLSLQLFVPMAQSLRRRLEQTSSDLPIPFLVPASDRTVNLDHNAPEYAEADAALEKVEQALKETNDYDDQADKEQRIAEISAGRRLLQASKASVEALFAVIRRPLSYVAKKFVDNWIGAAATAALALIGRLTGLW
jgi:hypothetical protein